MAEKALNVPAYCDNFITESATKKPLLTAIAAPTNAYSINAIKQATDAGLITPILVGEKDKIINISKECAIDISKWELVNANNNRDSAKIACDMAASKQVHAIMKGALHSSEILGAVVKHDGLKTNRRISHCYVMHVPTYHKPLYITDTAINITPDLMAKKDIVNNVINLFQAINGYDAKAKIAVLAAVETVNIQMQATVDAACLCKMADRQQIKHATIDGPLAFDNAISHEAAIQKQINSDVAGDPDILLAPDLASGNMLAKQLTFLANAQASAIVLGAKVPVILTSRADDVKARLLSCALAVRVAKNNIID